MSKVLFVDDEERFRTSLAKRLRARGYDVVDGQLPFADAQQNLLTMIRCLLIASRRQEAK